MATTLADPLIGVVIDERYEVIARLARGGMATVYRAVDRRLDREVALKVMHPHLAEGPDFVARFRREARASARLVHSGIVAVYDQGTAGDSPYLVMELVTGPNLRAYLNGCGSLTIGQALDLTEQILDALALAHHDLLVHRDVKPENVLLDAAGHAKVADFGLARAVSEMTAASSGTVLGTVAYLSPELVTDGLADARSDVYACGILLFEMLTGAQPFVGETAIQVAYQHVNSQVPRLRSVLDWMPDPVDDLVAAMTARNPVARPRDAGVAAEALRRARRAVDPDMLDLRADVEPIAPPAVEADAEPGTELIPVTSEGPGATVAVPVGAVLMPGSPTPYGAAAHPHGAQRTATRPLRRRRRWPRVLLVVVVFLGVIAALGATWYWTAGPGAYTAVPAHLVGMTQEAATAALQAVDLVVAEPKEEFDDDAPAGQVLAVDPEAGASVPNGSTITLTVSKGVEMLTVPSNLVGMTRAEAESALLQARLTPGKVQQRWSSDRPKDFVLSVKPKGGTSIPHDQEVTLVISKGPQPVTVPDLTNMSKSQVTDTLTTAGLHASWLEGYSTSVDMGLVMGQDPEPTTPVHKGDTVTVTLSQGPQMVTIPYGLVGASIDEAAARLENLGLAVDREPELGGLLGRVHSVDPAEGTSVAKGSTVVLKYV